jgi:Dolichyl-phosphate-mannose-protein mannosyltransferase
VAVTVVAKKDSQTGLRARVHPATLLLAIFSILYFVDVCLRASEKFFWYDELFTLYFSRLPNLHSLWGALNSGIDFNPPLFYLLTSGSNALFGEGKVATRLPEILGFWIFCVCLFRFVRRRAGVPAGFAAMLFPMLTGAYFYAYDARPHALVLGACGLALVCWQMATETFSLRGRWLIGLSGSLFLAFMFHCFALTLLAPFALAELFQMVRSRRIRWGVWLALLVPALLALPVYIPLLTSYRQLNVNDAFSKFFVAGWREVPHFYLFLFGPCVLILFGMLVVFALDIFGQPRATDAQPSSAALPDLFLALVFLMLPVFGVALGKLVNGPFFSRYFLSSLAGACIVIGIGAGLRAPRKWISHVLALLLIGGVVFNTLNLLKKRSHGEGEWLEEPSTRYLLDTTPGRPLAMHSLLTAGQTNLPIAVISPFDFIYLVHYDPSLKNQLYFVAASPSEFVFAGFLRLLECAPIAFNRPLTLREFSRRYADYLVYGDLGRPEQVALLGQFGSRINSLTVLKDHFLARLGP